MSTSIVTLALAASVLLQLDPVEIVVYLGAPPGAASIDTIVADQACRYLQAEAVPLPVPYTVRVYQRSGERQRYVPQPSPIATGLLSKCPPG